jgi:hypothetical protein
MPRVLDLSRCSSERKIPVGMFIMDIIRNSVGRIVLAAVNCPSFRSMFWAEELGSRGKGLKNVTALREMWPMVKVGWWDKETRTMIDFDENLEDEQGELEVVKRHITESEAETLTAEQIMAAFDVVSVPSVFQN